MENKLRGTILTKYKTITDFAEAINWDRKKVSRIINRHQDLNSNEIIEITNILGLRQQQFIDIFFPSLSTKWTF